MNNPAGNTNVRQAEGGIEVELNKSESNTESSGLTN